MDRSSKRFIMRKECRKNIKFQNRTNCELNSFPIRVCDKKKKLGSFVLPNNLNTAGGKL